MDPKNNAGLSPNYRKASFREALRKHGDKFYNFAWRLSGNGPDAWDLLQEALMKAYSRFESYDPSRPFDSWLFKILQNVHVDGLRKSARHPVVSFDAASADPGQSWEEILPRRDALPIESLMRAEDLDFVQEALNALPENYRTAIILCDMENMSYEKIGEIMDCPIGTVRSRVHQGRLLLKKNFKEFEKKKTPEKQLQ